mgnify:FL=1
MKKFKKIISVVLVFALLFTIIHSTTVFGAYNWISKINTQAAATDSSNVSSSVNNIAQAIITIVRVVCVGVAITMLVVLAIKYMVSAPGDRATIKKHAVVYIVGAVIMFASSGILGIIQSFASNVKAA